MSVVPGTTGLSSTTGLGTALLGGSLISGVSSLAGGKKQASAATQAAQIQAQAAQYAAQLTQERYEQSAATLQPFVSYGTNAIPSVEALTGTAPGDSATAPLTAPLTQLPGTWSPTMATLQNMPGYQFELQQGQLATQSAVAAEGLGRSGASVKAAGQYAQGLAASDWQANYNQWLSQQQLNLQGQAQTYNMLSGQVGTGLSAAGAVAGVTTQATANQVAAVQQGAAAQAAGTVAASNALYGTQGGVTQAGSSLSNALLLASLSGAGGLGASAS